MSYALRILSIVLCTASLGAVGATMCPDGQFHGDGQCKLCPDGSWTTAPRCTLAPDGSFQPDYGRGTRITPNGNFIPETGNMVMCPDGQFYPGRSCKLLPDGRFIGAQ